MVGLGLVPDADVAHNGQDGQEKKEANNNETKHRIFFFLCSRAHIGRLVVSDPRHS